MSTGRRHARVAVLGLVLVAWALLVTPPATAAPQDQAAGGGPATYSGAPYHPSLELPPTSSESQSKLWFHDQRWWGLLSEQGQISSVRVHELMPDHTWRPTSAVTTASALETGDAFQDEAGVVHVVTRHLDGGLYYTTLTYDAAAQDYTAGPQQLITTRGRVSPATITKDRAGRLWIAWATPYDVSVAWSDDGVAWTPMLMADTGTGETQEAAALIAYGDRLGLLWSDQGRNSFFFASHRAGDPLPGRWVREVALAGPGEADNHISLVRVPGTDGPDLLAAAVKTSLGDSGDDPDAPLIKVLVRTPDGSWSQTPVATVADGLNDPTLQVDATTRTLHLFASSEGRIVHKATPLDDIAFEPGIGSLFVLNNRGVLSLPTGAKEPVTDRSGMVVLTSDLRNGIYRHAETPIPSPEPAVYPDPEDTSPPSRVSGLLARTAPDTAVLSWAPAQDRNRWVPASNGTPAAGYLVFREGVQIGSVESTTFTDSPRTMSEATEALTVSYTVVAVDASGNRSRPRNIDVELPPAPTVDVPLLVGIGVLVVGAGLGAWALRRLWTTQRFPPTPPAPPRSSVPDRVGAHAAP